jgi:hypothetical protein
MIVTLVTPELGGRRTPTDEITERQGRDGSEKQEPKEK